MKNLNKFLELKGEKKFRIKQITESVYKNSIISFSDMSFLSNDLKKELEKNIKILDFIVLKIIGKIEDNFLKALLKLDDGNLIETVLISPKPGIWSCCISSQVGCPCNCSFCATGKMGFIRNLTDKEIYDQVLFWNNFIKNNELIDSKRVDFIVYMGMGEPFLNYKNVKDSLEILTNKNYFHFGSRNISISTIGIKDKLPVFSKEFPQINLAISLHFSSDEKRFKYMPYTINTNLKDLKNFLDKRLLKNKRKVFLEYIMIKDINDKREDLNNLINFIRLINNYYLLHVNLIPCNNNDIGFLPSEMDNILYFKNNLNKANINTTIRKSLGEEYYSACGQLANK
ncbi:23S rRNA (adenine(2503)-C(2))-methyltransferase RlmN [Patescibacteria group bacterium]|nr:23S rRNA (adenine(2503)-C(2))-methyltransferase RlmN [Patescibacteria group bacterium]